MVFSFISFNFYVISSLKLGQIQIEIKKNQATYAPYNKVWSMFCIHPKAIWNGLYVVANRYLTKIALYLNKGVMTCMD